MNAGWFNLGGAVVALIGLLYSIWRNNVENTNRLILQLNHDAEQRRLERERSLQRQIYLEVAEAIAQWQKYLMAFASTELSFQEVHQILDGSEEKIGKAYIVGTPETLTALDELNLFMVENESVLSEMKYDLSRVSQKVAALREEYEILTGKVADPGQQSERYQALTNQAISVEQALTGEIRKQDEYIIELRKKSSKAANNFAVQALDVILAIRRELGMPLSERFEAAYKKNLKTLSDKMQARASEAADLVKQKYGIDATQ